MAVVTIIEDQANSVTINEWAKRQELEPQQSVQPGVAGNIGKGRQLGCEKGWIAGEGPVTGYNRGKREKIVPTGYPENDYRFLHVDHSCSNSIIFSCFPHESRKRQNT